MDSGIAQRHGGPFGAVAVSAREIVGRGWNQVVLQQDPNKIRY
jgi:tRNA(Arg) A34 adenosine deaminase TadA